MEDRREQPTRDGYSFGGTARASARSDDEARSTSPQPDGGSAPPRECHRRGCTDRATFLVRERYQEETGHGLVEAEAALCLLHAAEERPTNLEDASEEYLFRVTRIPEGEKVGDGS